MADDIKCPQCGSRDLTKVQVSSSVGLSAATTTESVPYKCIICGKNFSHTVTKQA